jgi:hypothetical protein
MIAGWIGAPIRRAPDVDRVNSREFARLRRARALHG